LGERGDRINPKIKKAIAFSVPMDLHSSCIQISKPFNWAYSNRFLKSLKLKVKQKAKLFPELKTDKLETIKSLIEFDNQYTAPIHGFKNAIDYYLQCSSLYFLPKIKTETLIVSAKNDPFLSKECFPDLNDHGFIEFESPNRGGHVGFAQFNENGIYWSESSALEFVTS
jgi:predicted alpha/beta-fold hydrolase